MLTDVSIYGDAAEKPLELCKLVAKASKNLNQ